jgi:hypothetical protein
MDGKVASRRGEVATHGRLKRLAFLWAKAHGYSACAMEGDLPQCRYRADVAASRLAPKKIGSTAILSASKCCPICEGKIAIVTSRVNTSMLSANVASFSEKRGALSQSPHQGFALPGIRLT